MVVSQLMIRFMVAALLSAIVFLSPSIAVGSSSILDSGKSSKEIAEEILREASQRHITEQQKK